MFGEVLSPEEYNEWFIRNHFSKQILFEGQFAGKRSKQFENMYKLLAFVCYKESWEDTDSYDSKCVLFADEFNYKYWPLFQHFARQITDPFIYIDYLELIPQNEFLNYLATAMNRLHRNRLQCKRLTFNLKGNVKKFFYWIKNHVHCDEFRINYNGYSNYDEELLNMLANGAHCTSTIKIREYNLTKVVVVGLVQKFMELKNSDECQIVESIRSNVSKRSAEMLKGRYAEFIIKEHEKGEDQTGRAFEFNNNNVGKKLQLTSTNHLYWNRTEISLKIKHL